MTDEALTKVHIDLPNHWATGGESLWVQGLGNSRYRIDNVPFYAYDLNFHDVVEARAAKPDLKPSIVRVLERSGHQTLRVIFEDSVAEEERLARLSALAELEVSFERCNERYFALDLEPSANMDAVRERLDVWEAEGILSYETCEARWPGSFDAAPEVTDTVD